jgi:hypothetical protein
MITTIIFDLGGVYFTDGTKITVRKISEKFRLIPKKWPTSSKQAINWQTCTEKGISQPTNFGMNSRNHLG